MLYFFNAIIKPFKKKYIQIIFVKIFEFISIDDSLSSVLRCVLKNFRSTVFCLHLKLDPFLETICGIQGHKSDIIFIIEKTDKVFL